MAPFQETCDLDLEYIQLVLEGEVAEADKTEQGGWYEDKRCLAHGATRMQEK